MGLGQYLRDKGIYGWNWRHVLTHPWIIINESYYRVKWFIQRGYRGYSDKDQWDISWYLTTILIPMIRKLQMSAQGYPVEFSKPEEWSEVLQRIIDGLEANRKLCSLEYDYTDVNLGFELEKKAEVGLPLLAKYFNNLWD